MLFTLSVLNFVSSHKKKKKKIEHCWERKKGKRRIEEEEEAGPCLDTEIATRRRRRRRKLSKGFERILERGADSRSCQFGSELGAINQRLTEAFVGLPGPTARVYIRVPSSSSNVVTAHETKKRQFIPAAPPPRPPVITVEEVDGFLARRWTTLSGIPSLSLSSFCPCRGGNFKQLPRGGDRRGVEKTAARMPCENASEWGKSREGEEEGMEMREKSILMII